MIKIGNRLWVGSDEDFTLLQYNLGMDDTPGQWTIVHAARDPWHRQFVGYTTRGAPKDSPEYLYAQRGNRLAMNIFDTPDVNYVNPQMMAVAVRFIQAALMVDSNMNVLVHCNEGKSRGPTVGMLAIAQDLQIPDYYAARKVFDELYPKYKPMAGLEDFARLHWSEYCEGTF